MFACQILLAVATLSGCGDSQLSQSEVESQVAKQSLESLDTRGVEGLSAKAVCAEEPQTERTYHCRVTVSVPSGEKSPSQEVTAIVSKDGDTVVVEGL